MPLPLPLGTTETTEGEAMSYTVPTFPLLCDIWNLGVGETGSWPMPRGPDHTDIKCQLAQPLGLFLSQTFLNVTNAPTEVVIIRLPTGTQVNDGQHNTSASARGWGDIIELPPGSGTIYGVVWKATLGKGYPNEHIRCICYRLRFATGDE